MEILEILKGMLFLIPEIGVLVACIYYLAKSKSVASMLMTIGSFIGICIMIYYRLIMPLTIYANGVGNVADSMMFYNILGFAGFIGSVLFTVGLFLLVVNAVKQQKINNNPGF